MEEGRANSPPSLKRERERRGSEDDDMNPYAEFIPKRIKLPVPDSDIVPLNDVLSVENYRAKTAICEGESPKAKIDESDEEPRAEKRYLCQAPGCNEEFRSFAEHDAHYKARHRHICVECKRTLKSRHLLDLHLMEKHDSYFAVLSQRKPMFMCLLEKCTQCFANPEERQLHCIKEHPYLRKYLQSVSDSKVIACPATVRKGSISMDMEVMAEDSVPNPECGEKVVGESVPQILSSKATNAKGDRKEKKKSVHISFGHHGERFIPRQAFAMQKNLGKKSNIEMVDMTDLQKSLQS